MPLDMLMEEAKGMSDEALLEVVHFMQFLKFSPTQTDGTQSKEKKVYRTTALYKNQNKMAEGFDDTTEEYEEYM